MTWAAMATAAGAAAFLGLAVAAWTPPPLLRENHAGRPVPAALGLALVAGTIAGHIEGRGGGAPAALELVALTAVLGLFVVGTVDDVVGGGPRGLGGHLRSLARGRPTTGILKLAAGIAAGIAAAIVVGGGLGRVVLGAVVVATAVNVFNALDVVPGRSVKWATLVLAASVGWVWDTVAGALVGAALGAAVASLPFDLRERAMLGDGGSNPLGFLVGLALLLVLPTPWLILAAVVLLALQVAAETVTISRLIEGTPPLRWLDAAGRRAPS